MDERDVERWSVRERLHLCDGAVMEPAPVRSRLVRGRVVVVDAPERAVMVTSARSALTAPPHVPRVPVDADREAVAVVELALVGSGASVVGAAAPVAGAQPCVMRDYLD